MFRKRDCDTWTLLCIGLMKLRCRDVQPDLEDRITDRGSHHFAATPAIRPYVPLVLQANKIAPLWEASPNASTLCMFTDSEKLWGAHSSGYYWLQVEGICTRHWRNIFQFKPSPLMSLERGLYCAVFLRSYKFIANYSVRQLGYTLTCADVTTPSESRPKTCDNISERHPSVPLLPWWEEKQWS